MSYVFCLLAWRTRIMRISLGSVSYDLAAGAAVRGAGLLRVGREAARGREAGVVARK